MLGPGHPIERFLLFRPTRPAARPPAASSTGTPAYTPQYNPHISLHTWPAVLPAQHQADLFDLLPKQPPKPSTGKVLWLSLQPKDLETRKLSRPYIKSITCLQYWDRIQRAETPRVLYTPYSIFHILLPLSSLYRILLCYWLTGNLKASSQFCYKPLHKNPFACLFLTPYRLSPHRPPPLSLSIFTLNLI